MLTFVAQIHAAGNRIKSRSFCDEFIKEKPVLTPTLITKAGNNDNDDDNNNNNDNNKNNNNINNKAWKIWLE